jgi:hypothetical protein
MLAPFPFHHEDEVDDGDDHGKRDGYQQTYQYDHAAPLFCTLPHRVDFEARGPAVHSILDRHLADL